MVGRSLRAVTLIKVIALAQFPHLSQIQNPLVEEMAGSLGGKILQYHDTYIL